MKEKFLAFRGSLKKKVCSINHTKNKRNIIICVMFIILCISTVTIVKLNSKNTLSCANNRNTVIEGETITDLALSRSREIEKGPSKSYGKVIYLTIDDGPSVYTDEIIKILNENNVKATFFMINSNMIKYPDEVKNIVESGNTAGFHSVSHNIHKLYSSVSAAKKEFDTNQETFKGITGKTSNIIRLPFGSKPYTPRKSYNKLVDAGYKLWDWTLDTEDWKSTPKQIMKYVKKHTKNTDNAVLLMHERKQTVEVLDKMIKYLKKEGFEILPINESDEPRNYWNGKLFS